MKDESYMKALQQIRLQSEPQSEAPTTGTPEYFTKEAFWRDALKSESLLYWIAFHIGYIREDRT